MRKALSLAALAIVTLAGPARASEEADAFAPVKQFIDGFNKGDEKAALAACASPAVVIDEFAPFLWQGANACADWAKDFDADAQKNGITDGFVKLAKPRHVYVSGDKAYVVVPTTYDYKRKGKKVSQTGATMAVTLQKGAAGWKITGWAWATGTAK
jgi:ketosteroid isomerase-like protein